MTPRWPIGCVELRVRYQGMHGSRAAQWLVMAAGLLAAVTGCGSERVRQGRVPCTSWEPDVAPLIAARCAGCHGGSMPAGGYDLSSYLGALGSGSDGVANAIAGDPGSRLLAALDPIMATEPHRELSALVPTLRAWVVECRLSYRRSLVHAGGLMNPADSEFHGQLLADLGYDLALCADCHGQDFTGGSAAAPCTTCHEDGPGACSTCHGDIGQSGAHGGHLDPSWATPGQSGALQQCSRCHRVPADWRAPGHVLLADGSVDPAPAEVRFDELAGLTPRPEARRGPPVYEAASQTCRNVYCHGDALGDPSAARPQPRWSDGPAQEPCTGCHGQPPADHADDRCSACHAAVIAADGAFVAPERHMDGVIDVGVRDDCTGCHGTPGNPAPPADVLGQSATSAVTVGAHAGHVNASLRLRGPIACSECHREPTEVQGAGHIDTGPPAEVFPGPWLGGLAAADGAQPAWDRDSGRCTDVYCHGGGTSMARDTAAGLARAPVWTAVGAGQAACGRCHGVPPLDGAHAPELTFRDCVQCHPSVDSFGNIVLEGPPGMHTSKHIDGKVDIN